LKNLWRSTKTIGSIRVPVTSVGLYKVLHILDYLTLMTVSMVIGDLI